MFEKFLLWAIHQLNFIYEIRSIARGRLSSSHAPQPPNKLPAPQYLMRQCIQLGPAKDGFNAATGCGKTHRADGHNCHIYFFTQHPELNCIRDQCPTCRQVFFRFNPIPEEVSELEVAGISLQRLPATPPEFVRAYFVTLGRWPETFQAFGPGKLTVDALPDDMRLDTAE